MTLDSGKQILNMSEFVEIRSGIKTLYVKKGAGILPGKRTHNQTKNAQCGFKIKGGRQEFYEF
jgi:hypothetical protein